MSGRKVTVVVETFEFDRWDDTIIPVGDIRAALEKLPPEHLAGAVFFAVSSDGNGVYEMRLQYERAETGAEAAKRERDEREVAATLARYKYEERRATYERLKAEFEPK